MSTEGRAHDLVIFDVDGTLCEPRTGQRFRTTAKDWRLLPGRLERCRQLGAAGVQMGIASNQGGVAFGYLDAQDIEHELQSLGMELGIPTTMVACCFFHPGASIPAYAGPSEYRKPAPGMLLALMRLAGASPERTLMVGDLDTDRQAATAAGCAFIEAGAYFAGRQHPAPVRE